MADNKLKAPRVSEKEAAKLTETASLGYADHGADTFVDEVLALVPHYQKIFGKDSAAHAE